MLRDVNCVLCTFLPRFTWLFGIRYKIRHWRNRPWPLKGDSGTENLLLALKRILAQKNWKTGFKKKSDAVLILLFILRQICESHTLGLCPQNFQCQNNRSKLKLKVVTITNDLFFSFGACLKCQCFNYEVVFFFSKPQLKVSGQATSIGFTVFYINT